MTIVWIVLISFIGLIMIGCVWFSLYPTLNEHSKYDNKATYIKKQTYNNETWLFMIVSTIAIIGGVLGITLGTPKPQKEDTFKSETYQVYEIEYNNVLYYDDDLILKSLENEKVCGWFGCNYRNEIKIIISNEEKLIINTWKDINGKNEEYILYINDINYLKYTKRNFADDYIYDEYIGSDE